MRSRVGAVVVAAMSAAVLVGCGSGDAPAGQRTGSGAGSSSSTASPSGAAGTGSASAPSSGTESAAQPATGELVRMRTAATFRLPEGVDATVSHAGSALSVLLPAGDDVFWIDAAQSRSTGSTVDDVAEVALESDAVQHPGLERLPDRVVDGLEGYVLRTQGDGRAYYQFGTVTGEMRVYLEFEWPVGFAAGEEWVESVLASLRWR